MSHVGETINFPPIFVSSLLQLAIDMLAGHIFQTSLKLGVARWLSSINRRSQGRSRESALRPLKIVSMRASFLFVLSLSLSLSRFWKANNVNHTDKDRKPGSLMPWVALQLQTTYADFYLRERNTFLFCLNNYYFEFSVSCKHT